MDQEEIIYQLYQPLKNGGIRLHKYQKGRWKRIQKDLHEEKEQDNTNIKMEKGSRSRKASQKEEDISNKEEKQSITDHIMDEKGKAWVAATILPNGP